MRRDGRWAALDAIAGNSDPAPRSAFRTTDRIPARDSNPEFSRIGYRRAQPIDPDSDALLDLVARGSWAPP
jgi:hypothetical protein